MIKVKLMTIPLMNKSSRSPQEIINDHLYALQEVDKSVVLQVTTVYEARELLVTIVYDTPDRDQEET